MEIVLIGCKGQAGPSCSRLRYCSPIYAQLACHNPLFSLVSSQLSIIEPKTFSLHKHSALYIPICINVYIHTYTYAFRHTHYIYICIGTCFTGVYTPVNLQLHGFYPSALADASGRAWFSEVPCSGTCFGWWV